MDYTRRACAGRSHRTTRVGALLGESGQGWATRSLLIAPTDVLLEREDGFLRITDDVRHGLSRLLRIKFYDGGLINLILALLKAVGITNDVSDSRRDRIVEVGMLRRGKFCFRHTRVNVDDRLIGRDERH